MGNGKVFFLYSLAVILPDLFHISNDISESISGGKFKSTSRNTYPSISHDGIIPVVIGRLKQ
jgi:hypothetical protein